MLLAASLAAASALLGGALALLSQRRRVLLELTRTFAFAAAAGVVAFHLLPELLPAMGAAALLWIALGFALPWLLEVAARSLGPSLLRGRGLSGARVAAEVGFAALMFHSVVEGLALVAALQAPEGRVDLEIALVAHHAPLTAAVALPLLQLLGARAALRRVLAIAAAGVTGVVASVLLPGLQTDTAVLQVATAVTAGALLHVVADEIRPQEFGSRWERAGDVLACLAGLGVAGFGALLQLHASAAAAPLVEWTRALWLLLLAAAPALLAGLVLRRWTRLPADAVLVALALLGPVPAATLLALLGLSPQRGDGELRADAARRAPWLLLALGCAAAIAVLTPAPLPHEPWAVGLVLLIPLAARLDVAGAALLAAALGSKGLGPGLAVALVAGGALLHRRPWQVARLGAAGATVACAAVAALGERFLAPAAALSLAPVREQLRAHPAAAAAAVLLLALLASTVWSAGVRGWFAPLRHRG